MSQTTYNNGTQLLHVRFDGRSEEVPFAALDIAGDPTDSTLKRALAAHFDRPSGYFDRHVVARHSGAIVVRPEAIYG